MNHCFVCEYSWLPAQHYLESMCPECGADRIGFDGVSDEFTLDEPYSSNPFHVLGISIAASSRDIQAALSRLQIQVRLRDSSDTEKSLDDIRRIQTELLDSSRRPAHETLWFYEVPPALGQGSIVNVGLESLKLLRVDRHNVSTEQQHDIAVLLTALACHASDDNAAQELMSLGIQAWASWSERSGLPNRNGRMDQIWEWAVGVPVSLAAERQALAGNTTAVLALWRRLQQDVLTDLDPTEVLALAFTRLTAFIQLSLESEDADPDIQDEQSLVLQSQRLIRELVPISALSSELGPAEVSPIAKTLDAAALKLRSLGIALHNSHKNSVEALSAIEGALLLTTDPELRLILQSDARSVKYQIGILEVLAAVETGNISGALRLLDSVIQHASDDEERAQIAQMRIGLNSRLPAPAASSPGIGCLSLIVTVIIIVFVIANAS